MKWNEKALSQLDKSMRDYGGEHGFPDKRFRIVETKTEDEEKLTNRFCDNIQIRFKIELEWNNIDFMELIVQALWPMWQHCASVKWLVRFPMANRKAKVTIFCLKIVISWWTTFI